MIIWALSDNVGVRTFTLSLSPPTMIAIFRCLVTLCLVSVSSVALAANVIYIHGDVAGDGTVPSGNQQPFDQMLLSDEGSKGMSRFSDLVQSQGHTLAQRYDQQTTITSDFLSSTDVLVFGLHQKLWSQAEKELLHTWLQNGGGMFIYSDSASGGSFSSVGAQNTVGQSVTNNLISRYGMQVTVDQANGTKSFRAGPNITHELMNGRPVLEGEGVSPIAIDPSSNAIALIPHSSDSENRVSGNTAIPHEQNITISNPEYAALALAPVGNGNVIAMFDRQPMWNSGPGSNIGERDNREILRRVINFLAEDSSTNPTPTNPTPPTSDGSKTTAMSAVMLLLDIL